jgi:hypothetical protein
MFTLPCASGKWPGDHSSAERGYELPSSDVRCHLRRLQRDHAGCEMRQDSTPQAGRLGSLCFLRCEVTRLAPSRHFVAMQHFGRSRSKADIGAYAQSVSCRSGGQVSAWRRQSIAALKLENQHFLKMASGRRTFGDLFRCARKTTAPQQQTKCTRGFYELRKPRLRWKRIRAFEITPLTLNRPELRLWHAHASSVYFLSR